MTITVKFKISELIKYRDLHEYQDSVGNWWTSISEGDGTKNLGLSRSCMIGFGFPIRNILDIKGNDQVLVH